MTTQTAPYLVGMPMLSALNDCSDQIENIRAFLLHLKSRTKGKITGFVEDSPHPEIQILTLDDDLIKTLIYQYLHIDAQQLADEVKRFNAMAVQVNSVTDVVKYLVREK